MNSLHGKGIVITRPEAQSQALALLIRAAHGIPILFPLLEITPLDDYYQCDVVLASLAHQDGVIFISTNAVRYAMPRIRRLFGEHLPAVQWFAMGAASAEALHEYGIVQVHIPCTGTDSEALLNLPVLQSAQGKAFILVRGVGGRALLADSLQQRGAKVQLAECYQRRNPQTDCALLSQLWQQGRLHAIVVTSSEAMRHLMALAGQCDWLRQVLICAAHPRIAREVDGYRIVVAQAMNDAAIVACLKAG